MQKFLDTVRTGPRKIAVTGHFGSGKTEFAVSLAMAMANAGCFPLALGDLDIENPYFRSRERQDLMRKNGIQVYSDPFDGRNGSELQVIDTAVRAPLENPTCRVILDCGGDAAGAMVLNQFQKYLLDDTQILCIINPNRPGTDTPEKAIAHIQQIEATTSLTVTGLISNAHLIYETTPQTVLDGWDFTSRVSDITGIPALAACCMQNIADAFTGYDFDIFPIGMYMRDSYLDKKV